jgi:hypothetical protein
MGELDDDPAAEKEDGKSDDDDDSESEDTDEKRKTKPTVLEQLQKLGVKGSSKDFGVTDLEKLLGSDDEDYKSDNDDDDSENEDTEEKRKLKREEKTRLKERLDKGSNWKFKPMWRHRMEQNYHPHPKQIMKSISVFRATAIAVKFIYFLKTKVRHKFEHLKKTKAREVGETVDLVATYNDRVRNWMANAVRLPIVSIVTDRSLNMSVESSPTVYGVPRGVQNVLKITSAMGFETDRPKNDRCMQLQVRYKGVMDALDRACRVNVVDTKNKNISKKKKICWKRHARHDIKLSGQDNARRRLPSRHRHFGSHR